MRTTQWRLFVLTSLLLSVWMPSSIPAQQTVTPKTNESTTGSISGTVVNDSGQPLAGATVFVRPIGQSTQQRTTVTNLDGSFQLNGLEPALYTVFVQCPAYVTRPLDVDSLPATYRLGDSARVELIRGGVITGTVTNSLGDAVVGVRVRAAMVRDANGKPTKGQSFVGGERQTDDRGIYRMYGLIPGTYLVQAGGSPSVSSLGAFDFDAPTFSPSSTRDTAEEITVQSGQEATADIRYRNEPGHVISGTVRVTNTNGATISLTSLGGERTLSSFSFQQAAARGFMLPGLPDGTYELVGEEFVVSPPSRSVIPDRKVSDPVRVTIKGADVSGVELIPKTLASVAGKIQLENSTSPDCQNKRLPLFAEMLISAVPNNKANSDVASTLLRVSSSHITADKDGGLSFRNLKPGQYAFYARFFARYWYLQSVSLTPSNMGNRVNGPGTKIDLGRNWASIKSGERVNGLLIRLAEGAAAVRGKVVGTEGVAMSPDLRVYFVPAETEKADDAFRYFVTTVLADGTFSVGNMSPGKYWILTRSEQQIELYDQNKLRLPGAVGNRSKLHRDAETTKLAIELKPCQNVSNYELKMSTVP